MKLLFVCGLIENERQKDVFAKSHIFPYMAANVHQYCIAQGLIHTPGVSLEAVSVPFVGTFPREYDQQFLPYRQWKLAGAPVSELGGWNLFGVRTLWRACAVFRQAMGWTKRNPEGVLLLYSMITPFLLAAWAVKRLRPRTRVCLYVPDLPTHFIGNARRGGVYRRLKALDCALMNRLLACVDGFALLTEAMNGAVNRENKPYTVIEGIVSDDDIAAQPPLAPVRGAEKRVVYTGKTDVEFGVMALAEMFKHLPLPEATLEIYGDGNARAQLEDAARLDKRIRLHGTVLREEALKAQRGATVLVNPRAPDQEFTAYSFPSKTVEYLLAGRPVLMHKLPGIPSDYDRVLNYFPSAAPKEMAAALAALLSRAPAELDAMGAAGREFLIANKNEAAQAEKLLTMLARCR